MSQTRSFKMHSQLLYSVIQRQAGTLSKAVLEGVMNAVDAGASNIDVVITVGTVRITDDGKGFRNKDEIERFFETFGEPHDESERKVYGAFRMGRGQLFAFGSYTWRTGEFEMVVDIKGKGLDYVLHEGLTQFQGCDIHIDLYEELLPSSLSETVRDLTRMVKYVSVPVKLNNKVISQNPAEGEWDHSTEDAYIRLKDSGSLTVYNLGVLVREYSGYQFGCGGEVVSRKQLKVNFARNDIQSDCPVWKVVRKVVDKRAKTKITKKAALTDSARERLANQLRLGELDADEVRDLKLFTDVTGRHRSLRELERMRFSCCTVAPRGDLLGDKLQQHDIAFVFAEETLERFMCDTLQQLLTLLAAYCQFRMGWVIKPYEELTKDLSKTYTITDKPKPTDDVALSVIRSLESIVRYAFPSHPNERRILVGKSSVADAWTDGSSYIVFNEEFLARVGLGIDGWVSIGQTLLHEYCHSSPDTDTHIHTPEFYEDYHNISLDAVPRFARRAFDLLPSLLEQAGRRLNKQQLRTRDKEARANRAQQKLSDIVEMTPVAGVA